MGRSRVGSSAGELLLCEVLEIGQHKKVQLADRRGSERFPGDSVVLCLGDRYAPDQFHGSACADGETLDIVAGGGVVGRVEAAHAGDDKRKPRLRDIYSRTKGLTRDLSEDQAIETEFREMAHEMAKGNELDEGGEGILALPYLEGWTTNDGARQRIIAIVGGFGMGKTVTVGDHCLPSSEIEAIIYRNAKELAKMIKADSELTQHRIDAYEYFCSQG